MVDTWLSGVCTRIASLFSSGPSSGTPSGRVVCTRNVQQQQGGDTAYAARTTASTRDARRTRQASCSSSAWLQRAGSTRFCQDTHHRSRVMHVSLAMASCVGYVTAVDVTYLHLLVAG